MATKRLKRKLASVRTRDDFIEYLKGHIPKKDLGSSDYGWAADWFVAVVNAQMVFDSYTAKDLASAIMDNEFVSPRENNKEHERFFGSFFEEVDYSNELKESGEEDISDEEIKELEDDAVSILSGLLSSHFAVSQEKL